MKMRSSLGRVRGLGSAKSGTAAWWAERMTALALIPLCVWFVSALIGGVAADYQAVRDWMSNPGSLTLMVLLIAVLFWHVKLGLTVIVEDYIHDKTMEVALLIAIKFGTVLLGTFCIISALKIGLQG